MRRIVGDLRTRNGDLHRPPHLARAQRRQQRIGAQEQLRPEAAADIGGDEPDILLGNAQRLGHVAHAPGDHLVGCPQRQLVAVPGGDAGVRLHHRMALIRRRIGLLELDRRAGEGAVEIARLGIGRSAKALRRDHTVQPFRGKVELAVLRRIVDPHQRGGGARIFERIGDDQRQRLLIMFDLRTAQQMRGVHAALGQLARIGVRDDAEHARRRFGRAQVHRGDPPLGDGGAHDPAIGSVGRGVVALIGIRSGARHLGRAVDAVVRDADHAPLVDRIPSCGGVELHARASCCR